MFEDFGPQFAAFQDAVTRLHEHGYVIGTIVASTDVTRWSVEVDGEVLSADEAILRTIGDLLLQVPSDGLVH